jgi:hypothetical protein
MLPFTYEQEDESKIIKNWTLSSYEMGYNEYTYFHDFFKKSIKEAKYYTREYEDREFIVYKSKEYRLTLDSTSLRLFEDFKIGILTLSLKNRDYDDIESVLEINDYTRRLYPEYLDFDKCESGLVPNYVKFNGVQEKFEFEDYESLKKPKISKIINEFIPIDKIEKVVDDRMFTISYFKNPSFAEQLKEDYVSNDKWYEYVFVDGNGINVQNKDMQRELIKKATYQRWQNHGTLYGASKYSFVCLTNSEFPLEHMQTMYKSMFTMLLMTRATILKFSDEVSKIAKEIEHKDTESRVDKLYRNYIKFVNNFYFREITAKDQGLELYEKTLEILNIPRDIKELDGELEELFKFVDLQNLKRSSKDIHVLTWIGAVFLPPSIVTGFFGMNTLGSWEFKDGNYSLYLVVFSALVIPTIFFIKKLFEKGDS